MVASTFMRKYLLVVYNNNDNIDENPTQIE